MTVVIDARTGEEQDLAALLQQLHEQTKSGTLKLSADDGQIKYIYLKRGTIELLKTNRSRTLLGKALLKRRKLTEEQLSAALERQRAASSKLRLGEILVGMGIVLESDVHHALAYQIAEEVFELFMWPRVKSEFFRGEPPLDIFESEDLQARVSLSPVQLTREAVRRQNELAEIRRTVPSGKDVFALTPKAARLEAEPNPTQKEVLEKIDAKCSVDEFLEVVRAPDLVALRVLAKMVQDGDAAALPAQDLFALGQEFEERADGPADWERARARYLRAEELGHPDFDLPRRIGQLAEALKENAEACRRYVAYADRCSQAGYPDVASLTLARVLELDPDHREARERNAELLAKQARQLLEVGDLTAPGKAAEAGAQLEALLARVTSFEEQRRILTELVGLLPNREDLRERLAGVSVQLGDPGEAVSALQDLAVNALEQGKLERAVELLERILSIDHDDIMAIQSLAATLTRMGRTDHAVREYLRLAKNLEDSGLAHASPGRMVEIYEKVVELDPANTQARKFLARAYDGKKEADKAVANWSSMADALRRKGDDEELLGALDKLVELKPQDGALGLERAKLLRKLGRVAEAAAALKLAADAAAKGGDATAAQAAWLEVLAASPGDLEAHLAVAKVEGQAKDPAAAARRYAAVFELAMIAGREDLAEEAVKRALDLEPDRPEHRERLARLLVLRGRADEAARTLVRAARRARDDENLGTAQAWGKRALELDGTCDDARELLENLKRKPAAEPVVAAPRPEDASRQHTIAATITGGPQVASIEGFKSPARKANSALSKLKAMRGGSDGGGAEASAPPGAGAPDPSAPVSKGPEGPGEAVDAGVAKKASSAMNKLRALKGDRGGGDAGSSAKLRPGDPPMSPRPELAAAAAGSTDQQPALPAGRNGPSISKGPEGPGAAVDEGVAKKASSAMNKLRALKSSGGSVMPSIGGMSGQSDSDEAAVGDGPAGPDGMHMGTWRTEPRSESSPPPPPPPPPAQKTGAAAPISKGPEGPGAPLDEGVAKKASSAMNRLRALKSGNASGAQPTLSTGSSDQLSPLPASAPVSKGPEGPGSAVDEGVAKKASSAMNKLRALKSGTASGAAPALGAPAAASAPPAAAAPPGGISKGPEGPGAAVDEGVARKASSAMSRLKALKAGGGAPPPPPTPAGEPAAVTPTASAGPAPGAGPAPAAGAKPISKGPEAPGEAVDSGLAKKASSAMSKLKALKAAPAVAATAAAPETRVNTANDLITRAEAAMRLLEDSTDPDAGP